ncbi:MAG: radical SAM protein [bacterium]|nr:radical SAM protein [bacterium]
MAGPRMINGYIKALRRTARYHLRKRLGLAIPPIKLRISLTNRCNSRCIMCSVWKSRDNDAPELPEEITVNEIATLARNNRRFLARVNHVSLTGGEPTLRRDFLEIIRTLTTELPGRSISFNTNGFATARTLELVEGCLAIRAKMAVTVSLDAMGPQHNVIRGMRGDVFAAVIRTIEGLLALRRAGRKLKLEINMVMTNVNSDQLPAVHRFCRERGIRFNPIYITQGQLYQNQEADAAVIRLTDVARARLLRDAREIARQDPGLQIAEAARLLETGRRDFRCWAGKLVLLIEENCDVFPNGGCPPDFRLGNLRECDFRLDRLLAAPRAREVLGAVGACRACQIPCEYLTTLCHAEALAGYRKTRRLGAQLHDPEV